MTAARIIWTQQGYVLWPCTSLDVTYRLAVAQRMTKKPSQTSDSTNKYDKPDLRDSLKKEIQEGDKGGKPGQWSARKAQLLAQKYKAQGGGYTSSQSAKQKSLTQWTEENWTTSDGKKAQRKGGTDRYLPQEAWDDMSDDEKKKTKKKKQAGSQAGEQFVANTDAAKKSRKKATAKKKASKKAAPKKKVTKKKVTKKKKAKKHVAKKSTEQKSAAKKKAATKKTTKKKTASRSKT
jgi:hypothetical protein